MADISNFLAAWDKPDQAAALQAAVTAALAGESVSDDAAVLLLRDAFDAAANVVVKTLTKEPSQGEMLELYALFKQANNTPPKEPGMFDFVGKEKYKAWQKVKDHGQQQAQAEYIKLVNDLVAQYGTR